MSHSDLPLASGIRHQKTFEKLGWVVRRAGEHIVMTHPQNDCIVSIPNHKEVKRATLQAILRHIGITSRQYRAMFDA